MYLDSHSHPRHLTTNMKWDGQQARKVDVTQELLYTHLYAPALSWTVSARAYRQQNRSFNAKYLSLLYPIAYQYKTTSIIGKIQVQIQTVCIYTNCINTIKIFNFYASTNIIQIL